MPWKRADHDELFALCWRSAYKSGFAYFMTHPMIKAMKWISIWWCSMCTAKLFPKPEKSPSYRPVYYTMNNSHKIRTKPKPDLEVYGEYIIYNATNKSHFDSVLGMITIRMWCVMYSQLRVLNRQTENGIKQKFPHEINVFNWNYLNFLYNIQFI